MANKKKQPFLKKVVNLNTFKGKAIVILFAFVVIGGGLMVYKSFAAITGVWHYRPPTALVIKEKLGSCTSVPGTDTDANKNPINIISMSCTQYAKIDNQSRTTVQTVGADLTNVPGYQNHSYRACTFVKGNPGAPFSGDLLAANILFNSDFTGGSPVMWFNKNMGINASTYTKVCTDKTKASGKVKMTVQVMGPSIWLNVSGIDLEVID